VDPFASGSSNLAAAAAAAAAETAGPSSRSSTAADHSGPMPTHRQKAAAAAAETRALFPSIPRLSGTDPTSYFYPLTTPLPRMPESARFRLRSAVLEGDFFDIAVDWQAYMFPDASGATAGERAPPCFFENAGVGVATKRIAVLNTCSEKKAGGDWEGGFLGLGAEESLSRRSNLVQCLTTTDPRSPHVTSYYPIPQTGGIYSPNTVVLRGGHEKDYALYDERDWTVLSVISASAVRKPKVDETGMRYSFAEEKELQKEKMKTILRIAAQNGHINLVLGGFGSCGPGIGSCRIGIGADGCLTETPGQHGHPAEHTTPPRSQALSAATSSYKNPIKDVCKLWKELLFDDPEFRGYFANVVFAVSGGESGGQREFRKYFG